MNHPSIPKLSAQPLASPQTPLVLREGQMFHGQIKQLYPGQMAEVQIGGHKMMAKLEIPMKAGDAYYFQVKSTEPELQLKVVSGPLQASEGQPKHLMNLLETMRLPKSAEMQSLLAHFLKHKIPVSRELLLDGERLMKTIPSQLKQESLNAIQRLVELKLPLSIANLNSVVGVDMKEGMHAVLNSLKTVLTADKAIQPSVKDGILGSMEKMGRIMEPAVERALFSNMVQTLLNERTPQGDRFQLLQMIKNSGIFPSTTSLANLQSFIHSAMSGQGVLNVNTAHSSTTSPLESWRSLLQNDNLPHVQRETASTIAQMKLVIQNDPEMQQGVKLQISSLLERLEGLPIQAVKTSPIAEQVSRALLQNALEQVQSTPFQTESAAYKLLMTNSSEAKLPDLQRMIEASPLPLAKEVVQATHAAVEQAVDGKVMKDILQSLFKSLGVNYEAGLLQRDADVAKTMEMLKPQLVALMQDSAVSPVVREAAELAVSRMNGVLLQSGDTGANQQIIMQLPLELLGKRIDATLQWNGRMKDDGKIDPDFARILFYLDLDSIKKTVVDMQVQNRVVAVTVYNEDDKIKVIGNLLQDRLKIGLESLDYRLSGITFKDFVAEEKIAKQQRTTKSDHQGVDFRI